MYPDGGKWMSDDGDIRLPASIESAWGLRDHVRKGPKRGLSLERIVEAAVQVARADGLTAVSMHRVAAELGTSAMTLYRYVAAKDELLMLMEDAVFGAPPALLEPGESWRAGLARWAWKDLAALRKHPWVLQIPISGPPATPNQVAWLERGLHFLRGTGLTEAEKLSVILLLAGFVRNEASVSASLAAAYQAAGSTAQQMMAGYRQLLARVTGSGQFPALRAVIEAGVLDAPDNPDGEFAFGLERILDGIEVLVQSRG